MVRFLYFGRVSELTGCPSEHCSLPADLQTVSALRHWLDERFEAEGAFLDRTLRIALDNQIVQDVQRLDHAQEIALMPPVGGG